MDSFLARGIWVSRGCWFWSCLGCYTMFKVLDNEVGGSFSFLHSYYYWVLENLHANRNGFPYSFLIFLRMDPMSAGRRHGFNKGCECSHVHHSSANNSVVHNDYGVYACRTKAHASHYHQVRLQSVCVSYMRVVYAKAYSQELTPKWQVLWWDWSIWSKHIDTILGPTDSKHTWEGLCNHLKRESLHIDLFFISMVMLKLELTIFMIHKC